MKSENRHLDESALRIDQITARLNSNSPWSTACHSDSLFRWHNHLSAFDPATKDLIDAAAIKPGKSVLHLAAGTGLDAQLVSSAVGKTGSVHCSDLSPDMLYAARQYHLGQSSTSRISYSIIDADHIDLKRHLYDSIFTRMGLMFFKTPFRSLKQQKHLLKPNGTIALMIYDSFSNCELFGAALREISATTAGAMSNEESALFFLSHGDRLNTIVTATGLNIEHEIVRRAELTFADVDEALEYLLAPFGAIYQALPSAPHERHACIARIQKRLSNQYGKTKVTLSTSLRLVTCRDQLAHL